MNSHVRPVLTLLFLCLATALPAHGAREKSRVEPIAAAPETTAMPERRIIQVTGRLRLVGSEPFPELVISGQDEEWHVVPEDQHKLRNLQHWGLKITVEGEETVVEWRRANGSTRIERILSNITVTAIETSYGVMLSVPYDIDWEEIFGRNIGPSRRNSRFLYIGNVQVTGVGLEGSDPVLKLVVPGSYREWNIASEDKHKLMGLQDRTVAVGGVQTTTEGRSANGSVIDIHTLSNIVIIAVSEAGGDQ